MPSPPHAPHAPAAAAAEDARSGAPPRLASAGAALGRQRDRLAAVALALLGEAELLSGERYDGHPVWPGPEPVAAVLILLLVAPVAWRRSRPLASALAVFGIGSLTALVLGAPEASTVFVLLIATVFAGAAHSRHWVPVAAGAVVFCTVHALRDTAAAGVVDLYWVFGLAGISLALGRAVWARQHRIGMLEADAARAEQLHAEQVAAATAAERAAIAREMHDLVSHAVSVIVVQAQVGSRALPADTDRAATALSNIETSARTAMTELRHLLVLLDDGRPATTGPAASLADLPELLDRCRRAGLLLETAVDPRLPTLPPPTDATAFHVVREALTNAVRHAPGATVRVAVAARPGCVVVSVQDDGGPGHAPAPVVKAGGGRGLIGMRERVELVGGRLVAEGRAGGGFGVTASLPLDPAPAGSPGT